MDFNTVDTSRKLLAKGHYEMIVQKAELQQAKSGGRLIYIELKSNAPAMSSTGDQLEAGQVVFDRIMCQPTGKSTPQIVAQSIGRLVQAIPGGVPGASGTNFDQWVPTLAGKVVKAAIDVEPEGSKDGKSFPAKNVVGYYHKAV